MLFLIQSIFTFIYQLFLIFGLLAYFAITTDFLIEEKSEAMFFGLFNLGIILSIILSLVVIFCLKLQFVNPFRELFL